MTDAQKTFHALVVDDDAMLASLMRQVLERAGYSAESVTDPREAVRLLHEKDFDIAFVDVNMPEISGTNLVQRCRSSGLVVPFVLMTGGIDDAQRELAFHCGAVTILHKPLRSQDIIYAAELVFGTEDPQNSGPARS